VEELTSVADQVQQMMDEIPGVIEIKNSLGQSSTELSVEIDRVKMELMGIDLPQVAGTIRTAFNGNQDAKFTRDGEDQDINIILDAFDRKSVSDIEQLTVMNKKGTDDSFQAVCGNRTKAWACHARAHQSCAVGNTEVAGQRKTGGFCRRRIAARAEQSRFAI
jgi:multidrug efflux pump subunit AcrB